MMKKLAKEKSSLYQASLTYIVDSFFTSFTKVFPLAEMSLRFNNNNCAY